MIMKAVKRNPKSPDFGALGEYTEQLNEMLRELGATTDQLVQIRDVGEVTLFLANASIYLDTFGHIVIGWMWLMQSIEAAKNIETASIADRDFYQGKLQACQYFYRYELNKVPERLSLLTRADDTCLNMEDRWF